MQRKFPLLISLQKSIFWFSVALATGCSSAPVPEPKPSAPVPAVKPAVATPKAPTATFTADTPAPTANHAVYHWKVEGAKKITVSFAQGQNVSATSTTDNDIVSVDLRKKGGGISVTLTIFSTGAMNTGTYNVGTSETDCRKLLVVVREPLRLNNQAVLAKGVGPFPSVSVRVDTQ